MNSKIKNIIIIASIIIILAVVYAVFFRSSPTPALVSTSGAPVSAAPVSTAASQEFLSLLLNIRSIKLDDSILNNPAFGVLQDYTIILVPEGNEGRQNPFAPIGTDFSLIPPPAENTSVPGPSVNPGS